MKEVRLEVNLDVVKGDVDPQAIAAVVKRILEERLSKYITVQTVLVDEGGR